MSPFKILYYAWQKFVHFIDFLNETTFGFYIYFLLTNFVLIAVVSFLLFGSILPLFF